MRTFLEFEKPIAELEGKIEELRHLSGAGDLNIADEVERLQKKLEKSLTQTYSKLSPWQKVLVARHPERPRCKEYVSRLKELNNYLPAFPAHTDGTKPTKLPEDELIDLLEFGVPNAW